MILASTAGTRRKCVELIRRNTFGGGTLNAKKFLSALTIGVALMSTATAASPDDELSIMAAEQRRDNSPADPYDRPIDQPVVETPTVTQPPAVETPKVEPKPEPKVEPKVEPPIQTPSTQPAVGMPNPIVSYNTFEDVVDELGYVPLYVPKNSGYTVNYLSIIGGTVADIRFNKRWETDSKLAVRTYKRPAGEELKDISGVHGVKWRVDLSGGIPIYLARISENSNVAAWSVGQYTFAATADNLSFAAFRTLVFDELVDLSTHYFIDVD